MRFHYVALIVLVLIVSLAGCPGLNPFREATVPGLQADTALPSQQESGSKIVQKWLGRAMPILGGLAIICLAVAFYMKHSLLFTVSGVLGAAFLVDIVLLVYWKLLAIVVLIIVLAAIAAGLLLATIWFMKKFRAESGLLTSLQIGVDRAKEALEAKGVDHELLTSSLQAVQIETGTQAAMDISRGKDPAERTA